MIRIRKTICGATGVLFLAIAFVPAAQGDAGATFKQKCTPCHGADGSGNNPMGKTLKVADLRSPEVQKRTDAELAEIITTGKDKMPAYGKTLKPEDIKGLVAFIRSIAAK
jgi:mono/diheme cytochrome c family protein